MKPVEVENVGVMTIFVKVSLDNKKMEKLLSQLKMQFSHTLLFRNNLVLLPLKNRDSEVSEYL